MGSTRWFPMLLVPVLALGCGDDGGAAVVDGAPAPIDALVDARPDLSDQLYPQDRLLEIELTLAPADWDTLRFQERGLYDIFIGSACLAGPFANPFTYVPATLRVDGELVGQVGARKKGFLGSMSADKPSLKLSLDEYVAGQEYKSDDSITLNNAVQDPSYLRQCLGYQVFAAAGLQAPRCSFAHVTVNGADLGLYVHVESIDRDFVRRRFPPATPGAPPGNLYEGTLSDFTDGWKRTFEKETNAAAADFADIEATVAALARPDAELETALAGQLDVDNLMTLWATESVLLHWDGYAGNQNNFYIYRQPATDRFTFLPWGDDQILQPGQPTPTLAYSTGELARRLYAHPPTRTRYLAELDRVLTTAFDEPALLAQLDRWQALVATVTDADGTVTRDQAIAELRAVLGQRRGQIMAELAGGPPIIDHPARAPICTHPVGTVTGGFATTWGTNTSDIFASGTATMMAQVMGSPVPLAPQGAHAGLENGSGLIRLAGLPGDGTAIVLQFKLAPAQVAPGVVPIDGNPAEGLVLRFVPATGAVDLIGFLTGTMTLAQGSTTAGAPVRGTINLTVEWF